MRGFMSLPPCAQDGQGCASGTDCCGGYCAGGGDGGAPVVPLDAAWAARRTATSATPRATAATRRAGRDVHRARVLGADAAVSPALAPLAP